MKPDIKIAPANIRACKKLIKLYRAVTSEQIQKVWNGNLFIETIIKRLGLSIGNSFICPLCKTATCEQCIHSLHSERIIGIAFCDIASNLFSTLNPRVFK